MLNRTQAPPTFSPIEFDYLLPPCQERVFANGIPLYFYTDDIQPVVQLEMVFNAGLWYEPQPAVAQTVGALLKSGTSNKTSLQINEWIEQYGASVKVGVGPDMATISISCLTKHLSHLLPLVYELITDTQFPQEELDIYTNNAKQRLSVQLVKSDFVANRKIDEFVFGLHHPYGTYIMPENYDALTIAQLREFLLRHYQSKNCKMFMAGSFSEKDLKDIEDIFGRHAWNQAEVLLPRILPESPDPEKKHRIILDEKSVQGSIRIASHFPNKHHEDFYPMIVLNTVFGGYFGSRLMSNIREEKGYTYGIHSYMYNHQQAGAYLITTEAGKDVCEAAIQEIYLEMKRLREELVDDEELNLVKNYLLGTILGDLDGSFQIIQRWKNLILNGFTAERFNANIQMYKSISSEQLQTLANRYFQKDLFYELVVS